jgi:hypothetical protein
MRSTQLGSSSASTVVGALHGNNSGSSASSSGRHGGGGMSPSAGLGLGSPITRLRSPQLPYIQGGESSQLRRPPSARPVSATSRPGTGASSVGGSSSRPGSAVRPTSGSTSTSPRGGSGGLGLSGLRRGAGNGRIANGW